MWRDYICPVLKVGSREMVIAQPGWYMLTYGWSIQVPARSKRVEYLHFVSYYLFPGLWFFLWNPTRYVLIIYHNVFLVNTYFTFFLSHQKFSLNNVKNGAVKLLRSLRSDQHIILHQYHHSQNQWQWLSGQPAWIVPNLSNGFVFTRCPIMYFFRPLAARESGQTGLQRVSWRCGEYGHLKTRERSFDGLVYWLPPNQKC